MAQTYEYSATLMRDVVFIGRVKVACLKYASYIMDEASSTPAHSTRIRWAQQTTVNPDTVAGNITPTVVMDTAVQESGAAITDGDLQVAVETSVNKTL